MGLLSLVLLLGAIFGVAHAQLSLVRHIPVGQQPHGAQLFPEGLYVCLYGDGAIARVTDYLSDSPNVTLFPVDGKPRDLRHGLGSETIFFVSRFDQDSVIAVDTMNGQLLQDWILGTAPSYFSSHVTGSGIVHIPSEGADLMTAFDIERGTIDRGYRTGRGPHMVEVDRRGRTAYVSNSLEDSVSVIDLINGLDEKIKLPVGSMPLGVGLIESEGTLLVTASGLDEVYFVNLTTSEIQTTLSLNIGPTPSGVAVSDDETLIFVTNYGGDTVSVIDVSTKTVVQRPQVGTAPVSVKVFENVVLVSNEGSGTVSYFELTATSA